MSGLDQRGHALRLAECVLKGDGNVFVQKVICRILMGILLVGSMMLAGGSVSAAEIPQDKLQEAREVLFEFEPSWREREAQGKHSVRLKSGKEVLVTFNITGKWVEEGNAVDFHVYDMIEYGDGSGHSATVGWYRVCLDSGEIYDTISRKLIYSRAGN